MGTISFRIIAASIVAIIGAAAALGQSVAAAAAQPNIVFILADDMSFETIRAMGNEEIETPNLDRLARSGVTFTQAYNMGGWHGAICVASRTMFHTGRFLWHARQLEPRLSEEAAAGRLWPQYFRDAGYRTYMTGKWHVQIDPAQLFDHVVHVRPGMPSDVKAGYQRPPADEVDTWRPWDPQWGGYWEGGTHWSEVLADDAVAFLQQAAQESRPFFLYLAFNAPHDPRQSPQEYVNRYSLEKIAVPRNFLPEYPYKEEIGAGTDLRDEQLAPWPRTPHAIQVHRREYYALITHMDDQIGRILAALEQTGRARETVILFTADQGLAVGHHGLMGKQNMFEHSVRAPLIIAGPGIPPGQRIDTPVYVQDLMPTSLELASCKVPEHVEFRSLLPLLRGEQRAQYESIYGAYRDDMQRMIRQGDYKLVVYPRMHKSLLFNLREDPLEMNNLADNPRYAKERDALAAELTRLQQQLHDPLH